MQQRRGGLEVGRPDRWQAGMELVLQVAVVDGLLQVEVPESPAGEATSSVPLPFGAASAPAPASPLTAARDARPAGPPAPGGASALEVGAALFDSAISGDVRSVYDRSVGIAAASGAPLRIQLRCGDATTASWPWELLYDARAGTHLALSTATPIVRYVELARPQRSLAVEDRLRVLVLAATPDDLPGLDVDRERARMQDAVAPFARIDMHWLEGQSWRALQAALQREQWHVFHFVGHGRFDEARGEGVLVLCDESGAAAPLSASELGVLLGDHEPLRLAVLNSCEGARSGAADTFTGTAAALVRRGTPAVVAMQHPISDDAAIELSRSFYAALVAGLPVDAALTEARKAVAISLPGSAEWATPVLHMRAEDGRIFDIGRGGSDHGAPTAGAGEARAAPQVVPDRRGRVLRSSLAVGGAVVVGATALALRSGGEGPREPVVEHYEAAVTQEWGVEARTLTMEPGSIALVEVRPQVDLDPDLRVLTSHRTARRLAGYLGPAGLSLDELGELDFRDFTSTPPGRLVARSDEGYHAVTERVLLLAPHGGEFTIAVAGADGTWGGFELVVTRHRVEVPETGEEFVDLLLDDDALTDLLTTDEEANLRKQAAITPG